MLEPTRFGLFLRVMVVLLLLVVFASPGSILLRWSARTLRSWRRMHGDLRVGEVIAESAPPAGLASVERFDATEAGRAKLVTVTELTMRGRAHRPAVPNPI